MEQKKKACKVIVPSVKGHKGKKTTEVFGIVHINNGCYWEWQFSASRFKGSGVSGTDKSDCRGCRLGIMYDLHKQMNKPLWNYSLCLF